MFTKLSTSLLLLATFCVVQAQDIHFSQFYSSPLTLNPAMTGNIAENYRLAVTYRNQWASIPAPYSTVAASFDVSLLGCKLKTDHVGLGIAVFNDRSGDGQLNDLSALLSAAYHKALDRDRRFVLSAGGQAGYKRKSVNINGLLFESQINESDLTFDPSMPNGEPFNGDKISYLDIRAGGMFTAAINQQANFYLGGSYYHFTKPQESFLDQTQIPDNTDIRLNPRTVIHGGGSFQLTNNLSLSPSMLVMLQTASREITFGTAFGYHFNQDSRYRQSSYNSSGIYVGAWYRVQDAVILLLGVDYNSIKFGFSYDVNVSNLREATLNQGAVELSLTFANPLSECKKRTPTYCPRF